MKTKTSTTSTQCDQAINPDVNHQRDIEIINKLADSIEEKPKMYQRLVELWIQIKDSNSSIDLYESEYDEGRLLSGAWAWPLDVKEVETSSLNRCGDVLSGPLFSSDQHPWPLQGEWPMIPCLQIDLEKAKAVSGANFGADDGNILQLWISADDSIIERPLFRMIPKDDVVPERLGDIPEFVFPDSLFPNYWQKENTSMQIVGYAKKPIFTMQQIEYIRDEREFPELLNYPELLAQINEFNRILKKCGKKWGPSGLHLLGTFYPVQYSAAEVPSPLLCLDNDYGFMWGDLGTAQLCYSLEDGALKLDFVWSCY